MKYQLTIHSTFEDYITSMTDSLVTGVSIIFDTDETSTSIEDFIAGIVDNGALVTVFKMKENNNE